MLGCREEGSVVSLLRTIASLPRSLAAWLSRWWILLLFVVMPPLEMFLLLQIGSLLGPLQTFLLILITGVVGGWLAKREGLQVLRQLSAELQRGLPPGSRLVEGALVLAGGILLITPGVLTDLAGMLLIFPPTRRWLAPRVLGWLLARFSVSEIGEGPAGEPDGVHVRREPAYTRAMPRKETPFSNPFDDLP